MKDVVKWAYDFFPYFEALYPNSVRIAKNLSVEHLCGKTSFEFVSHYIIIPALRIQFQDEGEPDEGIKKYNTWWRRVSERF